MASFEVLELFQDGTAAFCNKVAPRQFTVLYETGPSGELAEPVLVHSTVKGAWLRVTKRMHNWFVASIANGSRNVARGDFTIYQAFVDDSVQNWIEVFVRPEERLVVPGVLTATMHARWCDTSARSEIDALVQAWELDHRAATLAAAAIVAASSPPSSPDCSSATAPLERATRAASGTA